MMDHWLIVVDYTDDQKPKKRGRPPKTKESPTSTTQQSTQNNPDPLRTPQLQAQGLPQDASSSPNQTSPPKPTPAKSAVVKALPTVRDHTTDQLTLEQDEYLPREHDERGETKVSPTGEPLGGRQFKMRTFYVAHRGDKRFMLATECARVLGYRDSYLLFNKNRSLHKIIASQAEKDELIHQEILPYSYRSRQIAIVTAKSMFRQFGARVIEGGRRVRDDYWEAKAIKQGFTEEDMAGDKRPGATKAREATAALEANNPINSIGFGQHQDIIYANATMDAPEHPHPQGPGYAVNAAKIEDSRQQAYGNISRPRQEITGAPYIDRTQTSPPSDIMHQAQNASDLNKNLAQQRVPRAKYVEDVWNKDHKTPVSTPQPKVDQSPIVTQSPRLPSSAMMNANQQPMLQHQTSQMMSPQAVYPRQQPPHHHNPHAQSPGRGSLPSAIRPDVQHQQRSSISYPAGQHGPQTSPYGYPHPNQMWGHPPPQPQQSPLSTHHPQYSPSPHPQQQQHHPSQSPHPQHPQQPPQLHHTQSSGSMHNLNYQAMAGMPAGATPGYSAATGMAGIRAMYPPQSSSPSHAQQQYMQQQATTAAQQVGMQGWAPPPQQQQQQPGGAWQQQGGYPTSSGY